MSKDFTDMGAAGATADAAAMNAACKSLQTHVEAAQAYASIPDAQVQADWSTGLAQAARAATDCIAGTDTLNAGLMAKSAQELNAVSAAFSSIDTRLQVLGG